MWGVCVDLTFHIFWVNNSKCTCQIIQQMNSYFLRSLLNCTGLERVPTAVPLAESRRLCHHHRCEAFGNWVGFVYLFILFLLFGLYACLCRSQKRESNLWLYSDRICRDCCELTIMGAEIHLGLHGWASDLTTEPASSPCAVFYFILKQDLSVRPSCPWTHCRAGWPRTCRDTPGSAVF